MSTAASCFGSRSEESGRRNRIWITRVITALEKCLFSFLRRLRGRGYGIGFERGDNGGTLEGVVPVDSTNLFLCMNDRLIDINRLAVACVFFPNVSCLNRCNCGTMPGGVEFETLLPLSLPLDIRMAQTELKKTAARMTMERNMMSLSAAQSSLSQRCCLVLQSTRRRRPLRNRFV